MMHSTRPISPAWLPAGHRRMDAALPALLALVLLLASVPACTERARENPIKPDIVTTPVVLSIGITGASVTNLTLQLTATARLSDGSTRNVTSLAAWRSSNTAVATVSPTGLVTGVGSGSADITATHEGVVGTFPVTVNLTNPAASTSSLRLSAGQ